MISRGEAVISRRQAFHDIDTRPCAEQHSLSETRSRAKAAFTTPRWAAARHSRCRHARFRYRCNDADFQDVDARHFAIIAASPLIIDEDEA